MNKIAVVTGANGGIGKAIAHKLAIDGKHVIIVSRNKEFLEKTKLELKNKGCNCDYYVLDITDSLKVKKVIKNIIKKYGDIDILVNCVGIPCFGKLHSVSEIEFEHCLKVNLIGTYYVIREVIEKMKRRNQGQIINIGSIAGIKGFKYGSGYVTSKFGMEGLTQVLWEEVKEYEVKVAIIRPGLVNSTFYGNMNINEEQYEGLNNALNVDDIADTVLFIVNQSERSNISEVTIRPIRKNSQNLFHEIIKQNY